MLTPIEFPASDVQLALRPLRRTTSWSKPASAQLRAALFIDAYLNARAWRKPVGHSVRHAMATARRGHGRLTQ